MRLTKVKISIIALFVVACICFGSLAFALPKNNSLANGLSSDSFQIMNQASIRKAQDSGIRFRTFVGNEILSGLTEDYELGTLFLPAAALEENQKLEYGKTFSGAVPVKAVFDGDMDRLSQDEVNYPNGKFFNAVLELSSFTKINKALNGKIVARSYIKQISNDDLSAIVYAGEQVGFSPAYVAAKALNANEDDQTIKAYVEHVFGDSVTVISGKSVVPSMIAEGLEDVEISIVGESGLEIPKASTFVKGLAADAENDVVGAGDLELAKVHSGEIKGILEGVTTVTLSAYDGKIVKTLPLIVSDPQVAFYTDTFTPEGNFTIAASNVSKLEIESATAGENVVVASSALSKTVIDKALYSEANNVVTIAKADLLTENLKVQGDYILTVTTKAGCVSKVPVYVREATRVDFEDDGEDLIGKLSLLEGSYVNLNPGLATKVYSETSEDEGGWGYYVDIPKIKDTDYAWFSLNTELVRAIASTSSAGTTLAWTLSGNTGSTTCSFNKDSTMQEDGTWNIESTARGSTKVSNTGSKYVSLTKETISKLNNDMVNFEIAFPLSGTVTALRLYKVEAV